MKGIILKDAIKNFGFKDGFSFWFRWSFIYPTQTFIFLNITHKPYCLNCGFHCKENCTHKKLYTKKEILDRWKKNKEEVEHVEIRDDGLCVYCAEEPAQMTIPNPNMDKMDRWEVCRVCNKLIKAQHEYSFGAILSERKLGKEFGDDLMKKAKKKIDEISYESGKEVLNLKLSKK